MLYLLLIVGILVLDRAVKMAVDSGMSLGETIPVIENIFHITYIHNSGAAFSSFQNHPLMLIILPAIVIAVGIIFVLVNRNSYSKLFLIAVSLICSGGLGNLTDRMANGHVIDMFDFRVFPVFNVADIAVCIGCGLLVLYVITNDKK